MKSILVVMQAVLLVICPAIVLGQGPPPTSGGPPPTMTAGTTVVGQVVALDEKRCLIRTEDGKEVDLHVNPSTFLPEVLQVGDNVTAVVLADGVARSIVKAR